MDQFIEGAWAMRWHILILIIVAPLVCWAVYMAAKPSSSEEKR